MGEASMAQGSAAKLVGKNVNLNVHAREVGGRIEFSLSKDGELPPGVELRDSTLKIGKSVGKDNTVTFKLKDGNLGLIYANEPIWVTEGESCPQEQGLGGFEIENASRNSLKVRVPNNSTSFGYTLRFADAQNHLCEYDPIIMNQV